MARVGKKPRKPRDPAKRPLSRQGVKTPPDLEAYVWVLKADGKSWREIATECDMSVQTVGRILAKDPQRLEALVSAQAEERARVYRRIENASLRTLESMVTAAESILFPKGKRRTRKLSDAEKQLLEVARPWAAVVRLAADSATKRSQDLAMAVGRSLNDNAAGEVATELTDDAMIHSAIELELVDALPPALREKARALLSAQDGSE